MREAIAFFAGFGLMCYGARSAEEGWIHVLAAILGAVGMLSSLAND